MSKTSQDLKAKKAKKLAVEVPVEKTEQKAVDTTVSTPVTNDESTPIEEVSAKTRSAKIRGKKYQAAKKKIDVNKYYPLKDAVKLMQETSISKFDGRVEAHINVVAEGDLGEIVFPHLEAVGKKVVILNDAILAEIKAGKLNFDILIATPVTMPKLLPFARSLGPKGLMPNPKNGTLTDKPEDAVKKLSVAKTIIRTEKKAPVVHILVGRVSQPASEIAANIAKLIEVVTAQKIKKLAICATMGPSVKIEVVK